MIDVLDKQIDQLDAAIAKLMESNDDWRQKAELLESVPGVGAVTSATLVAEMPALAVFNTRNAGMSIKQRRRVRTSLVETRRVSWASVPTSA